MAEAVERGLRSIDPSLEIVKLPMADGGEGTAQTLVDALGGTMVSIKVTGPLGELQTAKFGLVNETTAIVEMASASGLVLVPTPKRNPMNTTSYGTGQLIKAAMDHGAKTIIIGLGGSATVDGGMGMAQALGFKFITCDGSNVGWGGKYLNLVEKIDLSEVDRRIYTTEFMAAYDVDNPLCGINGAAAVFGPQKGADDEMVKELDKGLCNLARVIKQDLGCDIRDIPGAGAAGGLGAGLTAFLGAQLKRGIDVITEAVNLQEKLKGAHLVITGEGQIDFQTIRGKTPCGVAAIAKKCGIPVAAIAGSIGKDADAVYGYGIDAIESIVEKPMELKECMSRGSELVERAAARLLRKLIINMKD